MPHLFVNRPRIFRGSAAKLPVEEFLSTLHFRWEVLNTIFYMIGGVLLLIGSVLFLPKYAEFTDVGCFLFIIASVFYSVVSAHDGVEIYHTYTGKPSIDEGTVLDTIAASSYLIGALLFIVGSVCFLSTVERYSIGAGSFIAGSILFIAGAVVNSIQIFESPTRKSALCANLTAVSFVIGSTVYLTGSIPYIWEFNSDADEEIVLKWLAVQFIIGSCFFIFGGAFNIYRAKLVVDHFDRAEHASSTSRGD